MKKLTAAFLIFLFSIFASSCLAQTRSAKIEKLINTNTAQSLQKAAFEYLNPDSNLYNIYEAARLLFLSAEKGNYHSDYWIFDLWPEFEESGVDPPFKYEQFSISKKRATKGYEKRLKTHPNEAETYYRLSLLLDPGLGLEDEEPRSRRYLEKAASLGHKEAIDLLNFTKKEIDPYK